MTEIRTRSAYRRALLIPLSLALGVLLLAFLIFAYMQHQRQHDEMRVQSFKAINHALALAVERDSDKLGALLKAVLANEALQPPFRQRDRKALLAITEGLFQKLKQEHDITHFYFITPEREMFLRVHHPHRFGDIIDRKTTLEAKRTGAVSAGLELGAMGVFTLRVVSPWWDKEHNLLGYVELGMEIDKTLAQLHQLSGVELLMLVDKKNLNREKWEEGMRMVGRAPDWDRYPNHVLVGQTSGSDADLLQYHRFSGTRVSTAAPYEVTVGQRTIEFDEVPMRDFAGNAIGTMVVLNDLTERRAVEHRLLWSMMAVILLVWVVIMLISRRVVDHVYDRLTSTVMERDSYWELSQHDLQTELLNQTAFYQALDRDIAGCATSGKTLTVMMLDIDHFKRINDTYGHLAGDTVLRSIASLLRENARPRDSVARYGGEEFAIILPQTSVEDAFRVAERIRSSIEDKEYVAAGHSLRVTLSIGIAIYPQDGESSEQLVESADRALYVAKVSGRNRVVIASAVSEKSRRHT